MEKEDNIEENNIEDDNQNDDKSEVDTDEGSDNEKIDIDDDNSPDDLEVQQKKKRAHDGTGRRFAIINRYRQCFSSKSRKVRCDAITGEEIQRFCHESQWVGRIDTLKRASYLNPPLGSLA